MASTEDRWSYPGHVVRVVESLAIFGAAIWAMFLYFDLERRGKQLTLELLKTQNLQGSLAVEIARVERQTKTIEAERISASRVRVEHQLSAKDLGGRECSGRCSYLVDYQFDVENLGETQREITYVIISAFLGTPPSDSEDFFEIASVREESELRWRRLLTRGYYYSPKWAEGKHFKLPDSYSLPGGFSGPYRRGGGGTSELDHGERARGGTTLYVVGAPTDVIAFEVHLGFDDGKEEADRWRLERALLLGAAACSPASQANSN